MELSHRFIVKLMTRSSFEDIVGEAGGEFRLNKKTI
jgi:hypothetical protein